MSLPLRFHATTHAGHHHSRNEDACAVVSLDGGRAVLLVVCDGMGGMGRGDEASRIALATLEEAMKSETEGLPPDRMRGALRLADRRVREALCDGDDGMPGSTAVLVFVAEGAAHVSWVGDSRAYFVRDGNVLDRTRDHKLVEELVDAGQITADEAKVSSLAHVVTRALGGRPLGDPAVHPATLGYPWKLHTGDRLLLCTDGVTDLVRDDELPALLGDAPEPAAAVLVQTALDRGGHDNITCIVATWDGPSWVEDEVATPLMSGAAKSTLPSFDTAEVTFEGLAGADRLTAEIDRSEFRSDPPPPAPPPVTARVSMAWIALGVAVGVVLAFVTVAVFLLFR
jgi:protein phosphatase